MKKFLVSLLALGIVCFGGSLYAAHSDHGCSNCHVPHKAGDPNDPGAFGVPLWSNHQTYDGLPTFTLYSSRSFDALGTDIGQPDGASRLCLGCHDGSYSVFAFIPDSTAIFEPGDLANSHPISFTYDSALAAATNGALKDPSEDSGLGGTIARVLLDERDKMQCSSCHDVHITGKAGSADAGVNYMLRWELYEQDHGMSMCRTCHNK